MRAIVVLLGIWCGLSFSMTHHQAIKVLRVITERSSVIPADHRNVEKAYSTLAKALRELEERRTKKDKKKAILPKHPSTKKSTKKKK